METYNHYLLVLIVVFFSGNMDTETLLFPLQIFFIASSVQWSICTVYQQHLDPFRGSTSCGVLGCFIFLIDMVRIVFFFREMKEKEESLILI